MSLDLNRIPDKLVAELNQLDDVVATGSSLGNRVEEIIRHAYTEGLTLGLAAAHDKMVYRAVVDYIVPEHKGD